ncbi:MAG: hypothetical protein ACRCYA_00375, partial [Cetobacterium sp.]|uniref:hypothetical protein n=1 Tax=Cetobacterium sp. TaxID=2071632 RepID=UPI003F35F72D
MEKEGFLKNVEELQKEITETEIKKGTLESEVVTLRKEKEVVEAGITEINETYTTNKTKYDDILERIETCVLPTEFV